MLASAAGPAAARQPFLDGVWLGSPQLCEGAKAGSLRGAVLDAGEYVLTAQGLKSAEEDCQFLRVDKARGAEAWLVSALCVHAEGNYPELYSISALDDGRVVVTSVYNGLDANAAPEADGDGASTDKDAAEAGGVEPGFYRRCAGLAAP